MQQLQLAIYVWYNIVHRHITVDYTDGEMANIINHKHAIYSPYSLGKVSGNITLATVFVKHKAKFVLQYVP